MRRGLSYHNRRSSGGYNPFSQLGPTLDLTFAGNVTDLLDPNGFTLDTNFIAPQYLIGAQYTIWEAGMGLVSKTFSDIITFTRTGTTATYFNSAGVLTSAGADVPRFDYNPVTLAAQGLLIEEQRTNSIRNNTMQGAVAGTPGTLPTNWQTLGAGLGTLTQTIVGIGTSNGINYIDLRINGTTSTTSFGIGFETFTQIAAAVGQAWTSSVYLSRVGGTTTNLTVNLRVIDRDAGGVNLGQSNSDITSTLGTTLSRFSLTRTLAGVGTAAVSNDVLFAFASGVAIDITLRIGLPQLEQGAFATSVIPTTTTALTRSADVASVNTLSPWFNATAGTIYAEFSIPASTASRSQATFGDGTANERMLISNNTSLTGTAWRIVDGGVDQADINNSTSFANNATVKVAGAYAANDFATCQGGGTVGTDTSGTLPTVTALYLGSNGAAQYASSHLRRITYYPRRLSNAELQAITA